MSSTYWQIGRPIVEQEQKGSDRASYSEELVANLAKDLTARFGRGFSRTNVFQMRQFFLAYREKIQTPSGSAEVEPLVQTLSGLSRGPLFPLSWSHYVRLLTVPETQARRYYEDESLRGGWSVRELDRQIASRAYERLRGKKPPSISTAEQAAADCEIHDPFALEFLNLRVDLLLFHRRLRCLVVIDLKIGKFTHSDAGQMNPYLNYAREHWRLPDENPPVVLILCSERDAARLACTLPRL